MLLLRTVLKGSSLCCLVELRLQRENPVHHSVLSALAVVSSALFQ